MGKKIKVNTRFFRVFPPEKWLGYGFEEYDADFNETALLVVDVYGLGHHPDDPKPTWKEGEGDKRDRPALCWLGSADHEAKIVKEAIVPALEAARKAGLTVIYLNNSAPKIGLKESEFGKLLRRQLNTDMERMFAEDNVDPREYHFGDSDHVKISKLLEPKKDEYYIRKHTYSGFVGTRLDLLLRHLKIHNLFTLGFAADACLFTTVVDALWHDYKVILLRDTTLGNDFPEEQTTLAGTKRMVKMMEALYCVSVTSKEFVDALKNNK